MKFSIAMFFLCFLSFSQQKDSLNIIIPKSIFSVNLKLDSLTKATPTYKFNYSHKDDGVLYVHIRNTNLTDCYNIVGESIYLVKTVNYKFHPFAQEDSLNPYQADNMVSAVIMGSILFLNNSILHNAIPIKFKL